MNFVTWIEHHRRSLTVAAFALALAGMFAVAAMPVGLFPVVSFPRIRLEIASGSRPPRQQLLDVTAPAEAALREVPHVLGVESRTSRGASQIYVDFPWGTNMQLAFLAVQGRMAQILPGLPAGTSYHVVQMLPNVLMPFSAYALTSRTISQVALQRLAQFAIAPLLSGIPGVSHVGVLGGDQREIEVDVDPAKLRAFGLTLGAVQTAIARANTLQSVGHLQDNDLLYLVLADNGFRDVGSVRAITLRTAQGVVPLSEIATVTAGVVPRWYLVVDQGRPAVEIGIYQQANANSVALQRAVAARLARFMRTQPASLHLVKWYDQTQLVQSAARAVEAAILIGLVLAALVLLGFLRNWRATLVAMLIVPMAMLITVLLLFALGVSFNIMTLGGLAAAVGLLIDDVIVMLEHIARRAGVPGVLAPEARVLEAAREFLRPLTGSSLATIVIFVPLAFLSGITGAFFRFLSLTMASALVISYVLTAFVAPLLARGLIDFRRWHDPGHGRDGRLKRAHRRAIGVLTRFPALIALGVLLMLGIGYAGMTRVGTGFLPHMDEGGFVLNYQTAPGTALTESNRELTQVEAILRADPDVAAFSRRTGAGLGGDLNEPNQGDFFVRLIPPARRPGIWAIMDRLSRRIAARVPGLRFSTTQLMSDMIGDLVGRPQPVVIDLSAADPAILPRVARRVAARIARVPGIDPASVDDGVVPAGDALEIHVDPATAAMEGLTPAGVQRQVNAYLHGDVVTSYLGPDQDVGVRVWLDPAQRTLRRRALGRLPIRAPNGHILPLGALAKIAFVSGQPELVRKNLQLVVPVTAEISGRSLGGAIAAIRTVLRAPGLLAAGVHARLGGLYRQQQIAFAGMVRVFVAALIAELILLLFLYESFILPLIIVATSLLSTGAVFFGLWLTGVELNISALMGMVMIIGIATEMAIFYVSEYQALAREMPARQALTEAAVNRLRPIAMSTLAMVLALAPLAAAIGGAGDQMQQPLAIAIICGIVVQLPLVLLAMPVAIGLTLRGARADPAAAPGG